MIIHKDWDIDEVATGRQENGKPVIGVTFQNGLNDIEPDGSFVPCDMSIENVLQGVTHLATKRGRWGELRYGDTDENGFLVELKHKDLTGLSFKYTGGKGGVMTANEGKVLCHFDNDIDIEATPTYKGVKIELIINDPLTAPLDYSFSIKTYGQNYTYIEQDGGIVATGDDGKKITIHAPYAIDANGDIGLVTMTLIGEVDEYQTFKKVVDETWFRQAAAPVRIDPIITIQDEVDGGIIYDSFLLSNASDVNYGGAVTLGMHENDPPDRVHTVIYVSLAGYGSVKWLNGKFTLTPAAGIGTYNVNVYRLKRAWTENTVTWNNADTPWQVPGGSGADDKAAIEESTVAISNAVTDFPITAATLNDYWKGDSDNKGALLYPIETGEWLHFGSSENAGKEPTFHGEYTEYFTGFAYMVDVAGSSPDFSGTTMTTSKLNSVTMVQ